MPNVRRGTRAIPIYDLVSAGPGCDGGEVIEWVDIPDTWQGNHAGYIIQGNSMAPRIPDGAKVIVRLQDYSPAKNIVVCFTPEEGMLVKFLKETRPDNVHVLVSFNPNFDPIWAKELHIKGVVVEIRTPVQLINGAH